MDQLFQDPAQSVQLLVSGDVGHAVPPFERCRHNIISALRSTTTSGPAIPGSSTIGTTSGLETGKRFPTGWVGRDGKASAAGS